MANHQIFYINSTSRISGTDASFSYSIPMDVSAGYDTVCVLGCSIPKSYYLIQAGFNTFTLQEGMQTAIITIPPANYSYLSFMAVLIPLLNTASPNGWTYSMSYPNRLTQGDTGMFTYSVTGNSGVQPAFITTTNVYEQLGFASNTTNVFVSNKLTSTAVVNFSQEESLFIHSDCAKNADDDILQDIYDANSPPMSFIVYQNTGNIEHYSKALNASTRTFNFSLTDENKRVLNLNGRNMLITIVIYKKDNISDVIKSVIKLNLKSNLLDHQNN